MENGKSNKLKYKKIAFSLFEIFVIERHELKSFAFLQHLRLFIIYESIL